MKAADYLGRADRTVPQANVLAVVIGEKPVRSLIVFGLCTQTPCPKLKIKSAVREQSAVAGRRNTETQKLKNKTTTMKKVYRHESGSLGLCLCRAVL